MTVFEALGVPEATRPKRTEAQADALNHAAEVDAVRNSIGVSRVLAESALAALGRVERVYSDDCGAEEPGYEEFGPCSRDFGHDGGHYVVEEGMDDRRPNGTHPWDY